MKKKEPVVHTRSRNPHVQAPYALIVFVVFLIYSPFFFGIPGFDAEPGKMWYNLHAAFLIFSIFAACMAWLVLQVAQLENRLKYPLLAALGLLGIMVQLLLLYLTTPAYDYFVLMAHAPKFCSVETVSLYGSIERHIQFCNELNRILTK